MKNKIISFILLLAMTLSFACVGTVSAESEISESATELTLLDDLGFLSADFKTDYYETRQMSRAQFAAFVCSLSGIDAYGANADELEGFSDVTDANKHWESIVTASKYGYMNGDGQGHFNPNENVELTQVIKVFVSMLGYDELAKVKGGYPTGYMAVAQSLSLTDGIAVGNKLYSGSIIKLAYNMLHTKVYKIESISNSSVIMTTSDDASFLKEFHNIDVIKGQVRGAGGKMMIDGDALSSSEIILEDTVMKTVDDKSYGDYFGCIVNAYVDSQGKVLALCNADYMSRKVKLLFEDIESFSFDAITYYENDKEVKISTSAETDFIYNGKPPCVSDLSALRSKDGEVEIIFADDDKIADCISITVSDNFVVKKVDLNAEVIYDMYSSKKLSLSELDSYSIINSFGEYLTIEELSAYDVLSVVQSTDKKLTTIYYSNSEVEGTVSQIDSFGRYVIGNKAFEIAQSFAAEADEVKLGNSGIFPLDIYGKIAAFKSLDDAYKYGYIIAYGTKSGLESEAQIKLIDQSGTISIFNVNKKLIYDGKVCDGYEKIAALKNSVSDPGELIRYYTVNGAIRSIDTLAVSSQGEDDSLTTLFKGYDDNKKNQTSLMYNSNQNIMGSKVALSSETKVFYVPPQYSSEDSDYTVTAPNFKHDNTYYINAYADDKDSHVASVVLVYGGASVSIGKYSPFFVVDSISQAINENGDEVIKIRGYSKPPYASGGYDTVCVRDEKVLDELVSLSDSEKNHTLSCGDVIKYETDNDGNVNYIELFYEYETDTVQENTTVGTSIAKEARTVRGRVYSEGDGVIYMTQEKLDHAGVEIDYSQREVLRPDLYEVLIVNEGRNGEKVLEKTTSASILDYKSVGGECSEILICSVYNNPGIILIRNK